MVSLQAALAAFRAAYPEFDQTAKLDELRATEYGRLDAHGHAYLDYTGAGLYAERQLRKHLELLAGHVFGNPHSSNPTSRAMTEWVEQARARVLAYFNASPDEYLAIFTPNATGALKLVGEAYPFGPDSRFLLTFDNHNSVNGIREFARVRQAATTYLPVVPPEMRMDEEQLLSHLDRPGRGNNLFAYPAQSNFTGVQHPLEWIAEAQARGWDVLVDAAAFVPANRLDLQRWHPDFVPLSFYKIFGYPTGVGCLLARKAAIAKLRRPWFAGGSIFAASVQGDGYYLAEGAEGFEDGTLNFLALPAVTIGIEHIEMIGLELIHARVRCLTAWLLDNLAPLQHSNGAPLVRLYGPDRWHKRGATIALNLLDPAGHMVDERFVDRRAGEFKLSLRTGCFCNPGAGEVAFRLSQQVLIESFKDQTHLTYDEWLKILKLESAGAVRVSLGVVSSFADVHRFLSFAETFRDEYPDTSDLPPRLHC